MSEDLSCLILCGGRGTRLGELTEQFPKTLVEIAGRPCLQHIIEGLIKRGQRRIVVCSGFRGELIAEFLERADFDAEIEISNAGDDASMLQRLYEARRQIGPCASVTYGDTLVDVDLDAMSEQHRTSGASITLTTALVQSPFGLLTIAGTQVTRYQEKPTQPYYVGHMLIERAVLDTLDESLLDMPDGEGLVTLFQRTAKAGLLGAFEHEGPAISFNTPQELDRAHRDAGQYFTLLHEEKE